MHGNYEYSLTGEQQSAIQVFLRMAIPKQMQNSPEFQLLHDLTYANSWNIEPKYKVPENKVATFDFVTHLIG
jgi:hypothetical protein